MAITLQPSNVISGYRGGEGERGRDGKGKGKGGERQEEKGRKLGTGPRPPIG